LSFLIFPEEVNRNCVQLHFQLTRLDHAAMTCIRSIPERLSVENYREVINFHIRLLEQTGAN
jgi:hypothetical protein